MSINPVPNLEPGGETSLASHDSREAQAPHPAPARKVQPDAGTSPEAEAASSAKVSSLAEMPKDEVEVQRDNQTNGEIVVRYMDHAGSLILQVPSEQILNLTRSIDRDLEREQEVRAKAETAVQGHPGGESDGH